MIKACFHQLFVLLLSLAATVFLAKCYIIELYENDQLRVSPTIPSIVVAVVALPRDIRSKQKHQRRTQQYYFSFVYLSENLSINAFWFHHSNEIFLFVHKDHNLYIKYVLHLLACFQIGSTQFLAYNITVLEIFFYLLFLLK